MAVAPATAVPGSSVLPGLSVGVNVFFVCLTPLNAVGFVVGET
jgi:hypothetical protein